MLFDAVIQWLGVGLMSQLPAYKACAIGPLFPLAEQRIMGANWAWLIHQESENHLLTKVFCQWITTQLALCDNESNTGCHHLE